MNCTTFETWLHTLSGQRDRALPADAAAHLADCVSCRARWAAEARLDSAIMAWRQAPLPTPSVAPIIHAVLADRVAGDASQSGKSFTDQPTVRAPAKAGSFGHVASARAMWTTVACALAVLVAVSWGLRAPRPSAEYAGSQSGSSHVASTVPVSDSVAALWTDVQLTSQSVAHETVQALGEWSTLPSGSVTTAPVATPTPVPATPGLRPISEPISERVNTAFGFLGDVLPALGSSG